MSCLISDLEPKLSWKMEFLIQSTRSCGSGFSSHAATSTVYWELVVRHKGYMDAGII